MVLKNHITPKDESQRKQPKIKHKKRIATKNDKTSI